ncbi:hypothetical protein B0T26DRAFT_756396 [Lasiosphaeria miniovina]|uniref:F-box domain-containing protein n=1 Tax=Lasiosphaeria miniovina TaxID=1954250 RepID=A0AA40A0E0_9PEZI|nr:uncharacterized protein B0T26DRAFT_756396 [Lasiosphaeria miniovina]KAK0706988.1 hypothetical protein B0T26DRAFT_756396 [Lasiosphaeria miniovina]
MEAAKPTSAGEAIELDMNDTTTAALMSLATERPRHIAPVPNEVLLQIFSYLQASKPNRRVPGEAIREPNKSIQNIRLVSRQFCTLASHMLIPVIDIDVTPSGLRIIDSISRHPTISCGVEVVRICVNLSSQIHAESMPEFMEYGHAIRDHHPEMAGGWRPADTQNYFIDNLNEDLAYRDWTLRRDEYQSYFHDQMTILTSGQFVRGVAAALAQMPSARSLCLYNTNFYI